MKLYIRQRIFSIGDKYDIIDESGAPVFNVRSEVFSFGAKIHLCDMTDSELYYIEQRLFRFLPEYHIYNMQGECAVVNKRMSFFKARLDIDSAFGQYEIDGDVFAMDFVITRNGGMVGSIAKKWLSFGDSYELDIGSDEDAGFFCALVVAIDHCLHNENK